VTSYQDKSGRERTKISKRVTTHRDEARYDINGCVDETLSPAQMMAMFHLMYDGEHEDLGANKKPTVSGRLFLLCAMPLEYHPIDDPEQQRLVDMRESFYQTNTLDAHQNKLSQIL